jgi:hypothetical protein
MPKPTQYSCAQHEFASAHIGKLVTVRGMWMGDFLATMLEAQLTQCRVRCEKKLDRSRALRLRLEVVLPYMDVLKLTEPTITERGHK